MSGGLFQLAGLVGAEPDDNTEDLLKKGKIDEEQALLLQGLMGEAPVDPGDNFREYMGSQGGAKGFFGSALNPLITRGLFSDDFNDYRDAKASYATDKAIFDARLAGATKYMENSAGDAQDTALADLRRQGITSGPLWDAAVIEAGGVDKYNPNDSTLAPGGARLDHQGNVIAYNSPTPDPTSQERNLRARQELMAREPADKNSPEHKRWLEEVRFFESSVRANSVVNGVVRSGSNADVIGNEQSYHDSATKASEAAAAGDQQVKSADKMFSEGYARVRESGEQYRDYGDRMENVQTAIDGFADGTYDTNFVRGVILKATGLGSYEDGELQSMGTDEAINKVTNFNGHTTDFEYGEAFKAAFAQVINGTPVNQATLDVVMKGLQRGQAEALKQWQGGVADMVSNAQTDGERLALSRQNTFNRRQYNNAPDIGTKEGGRIYIGGDPGTPDNWLEVK